MEIKLPSASGEIEHARVTWTFKHLPSGLTPVITFDSQDVIASGPTTTLGATPRVTFEIRFPPNAQAGRDAYVASYRVSLSSRLTGALELPVLEQPSLVVVVSPDPPGGGIGRPAHPHAAP